MQSSKQGFTLMELLVAVGLMAIMFTSLSVVFKQATDLIRRSESEVDVYQNFRLVSKIMKKDFESIINYEEPVFYNRYDETGNVDEIDANPAYKGKLDYCGYLRIEDHTVVDADGDTRVMDNVSFMASDSGQMKIQSYIADAGYVKTKVVGTDLVEISYAVEDRNGAILGQAGSFDQVVNRWRLVRYIRKVVPKAFVSPAEEGFGYFGLVYKGYESMSSLNGNGAQGMSVFNGNGVDRRIVMQNTSPITWTTGMDARPNKYGRRDVIAEGCAGFDIKYWYYRRSEPLKNWQERDWDSGTDGNPDGTKDPYVNIGHFFNGCPPNPACMNTPLNPDDDETQFQKTTSVSADKYAADHPNWWYLPRMIQVRLKLVDEFRIIEQPFVTRIFLPASDPRPRVP